MSAIAIIFTAFASIFLIAIVRGWVMTVLWSWFAAPTFHLPELTIATAIGLALLIGMFTPKSVKSFKDAGEKKSSAELVGEVLGVGIGAPLMVLFLGWITKMFV